MNDNTSVKNRINRLNYATQITDTTVLNVPHCSCKTFLYYNVTCGEGNIVSWWRLSNTGT